MLQTLTKRDGTKEAFSNAKGNNWSLWGARGLQDRLDWSTILYEAREAAPEEMDSQDWQMMLVKRLAQRGSQSDGWPYMLMAGRLYAVWLMKHIHGGVYPHLRDHLKIIENLGLARNMGYTDSEIDHIDRFILKHESNFEMSYTQVEQYYQKYSLRNRATNTCHETPQFTMIRMAMAVYEDEQPMVRLPKVRELYMALNEDLCNPPTPNYSALGTDHYGMASCCLIAAGDSADSIMIAGMIGYAMTKASAGLGMHLDIRSLGDPVAGGRVAHAGKLNYVRKFVADCSANKQGMRGGALNVDVTVYDPEIEMMAKLQNPRTPIEVRERRVNVTYQTNPFFADKYAKREKYFTFTSFSAPDLYEAFFLPDQSEFERLYAKYEADPAFVKNYRDAYETGTMLMTQEIEVSTLFWNDPGRKNRHTPFKDPILQTNLCVAPETQILTDQGYFPIRQLENQKVSVWNGEEFSETIVRRTSEDSELMTIDFDNGLSIDCTPYHKFYIQAAYHSKGYKEVRAVDLRKGMALIKFDLPVIGGDRHLNRAYANGFYTGDGCLTPQGQRVYLYNGKRSLRDQFEGIGKWTVQDKYDREYAHYQDLEDKYFVPLGGYTIDSRLEWLAGLCDSDGTVARNGTNESIQITTTELDFAKDVILMLQTLGVNARIGAASPEGIRPLPDGRGGRQLYRCRETFRVLINSNDTQNLLDLGINFRRLKVEYNHPQRNAGRFVRVERAVDTGRRDATFCFTEPKRHMGVFNGLITGQCVEISNPTKKFEKVEDLYGDGEPEKGEVGICNIGSIPVHNFPFNVNDVWEGYEKYKRGVRAQLEIIDYAIDNSEYNFPAIAKQAKNRRNASVGMSGVATLMARLNLKFNTPEGRRAWHILCERHAYAVTEVALEMGIEKGNAPWIHRTKWPDGWLFIDTYHRPIDKHVDATLMFPWEKLRARIIQNKGIRFSSLLADMPGEQATRKGTGSNSIYPLFNLAVDLSDGSSAMPWTALDNDLIGHQYHLVWDNSAEDISILYGIKQKFTDQQISADEYIDRTLTPNPTTDELRERFLDRYRHGRTSKYYTRSRTDQGGKQEDLPALNVIQSPLPESDALIAIKQALSKQDDGLGDNIGASCTLDGVCGT